MTLSLKYPFPKTGTVFLGFPSLMSYSNPYPFDTYASTPTTPTSAFAWEHQDHQQTDMTVPSQPYQPTPPLPMAQHIQDRVISGALYSAGMSGDPELDPLADDPLDRPASAQGSVMDARLEVAHTPTMHDATSFSFHAPAPSMSEGSQQQPVLQLGRVAASAATPMSRPHSGSSTTSMMSVPQTSAQGTRAVSGIASGPVRAARSHAQGPHPYRRPSGQAVRVSPEVSTNVGASRSDDGGSGISSRVTREEVRGTTAPAPQQRKASGDGSGMYTQPLRFIPYQAVPATGSSSMTVGCPAQGQSSKQRRAATTTTGGASQSAQKVQSQQPKTASSSTSGYALF
jgi:hypothetical protein